MDKRPGRMSGSRGSGSEKTDEEEPVKKERKIKKLTAKEKETIGDSLGEMVGAKAAMLFNKDLEIVKKLPISRLGYFTPSEDIYAIAINDTALPNVIRAAEKLLADNLIAKNFTTTDTDINLISL